MRRHRSQEGHGGGGEDARSNIYSSREGKNAYHYFRKHIFSDRKGANSFCADCWKARRGNYCYGSPDSQSAKRCERAGEGEDSCHSHESLNYQTLGWQGCFTARSGGGGNRGGGGGAEIWREGGSGRRSFSWKII